jgi:DNA-binding protein HU-beta
MTTKKELVAKVADSAGVTKTIAENCINALLSEIQASVAVGHEVFLHDFGIFKPVTRAARECRNPKTGDPIQTVAKNDVKFKPMKRFRDVLNS